MTVIAHPPVWWIGLGVGTVGYFTASRRAVEKAREVGTPVVEYVPSATYQGAVEALERTYAILNDTEGGEKAMSDALEVVMRALDAIAGGQ